MTGTTSTARTIRLRLAYDGTPFVGWQRQAEGVSVQALLEEALARIEEARVVVVGAGRTDAGVHALGQVASVRLTHAIPLDALARALNAVLPPELRVLAVDEVPAAFHARYDARAKTYRYVIANGRLVSPFDHRYAWVVPQPLDAEPMARAAAALAGTHDFAAFQGAGSSVRGTTRTIIHSDVLDDARSAARFGGCGCGVPGLTGRQDDGSPRLVYEVTGTGFLRHMVRAIVGTLVEIGDGRRAAESMNEILASRDRSRAGATAPAHGLCLVGIAYDGLGDTVRAEGARA